MNHLENLEGRVFLSASPLNTTVKADRLVVQESLLQFRSDIFASQAKLLVDIQSIKANITTGDTTLVDPIKQFRTDLKTMHTQLKEDRLNEKANALKDLSQIKLDLAMIIHDRKDETALASDRTKLHDDRVQFQNDLIAGLDARIATRQSFEDTLSTNAGNIVTAINNDTAASDALKAAATAFSNDRLAEVTTLTSDLQKIQTARTQLVNDLTAEQNT